MSYNHIPSASLLASKYQVNIITYIQYDWHYPNCVPAIRLRAPPSIPPWREVQRLPGDGQKPQGVQGEGGWEGAAVPLNLYVSTNFFCSFSILNSKISKNMHNFLAKLRNATIYPLEVQFLENFFLLQNTLLPYLKCSKGDI